MNDVSRSNNHDTRGNELDASRRIERSATAARSRRWMLFHAATVAVGMVLVGDGLAADPRSLSGSVVVAAHPARAEIGTARRTGPRRRITTARRVIVARVPGRAALAYVVGRVPRPRRARSESSRSKTVRNDAGPRALDRAADRAADRAPANRGRLVDSNQFQMSFR